MYVYCMYNVYLYVIMNIVSGLAFQYYSILGFLNIVWEQFFR